MSKLKFNCLICANFLLIFTLITLLVDSKTSPSSAMPVDSTKTIEITENSNPLTIDDHKFVTSINLKKEEIQKAEELESNVNPKTKSCFPLHENDTGHNWSALAILAFELGIDEESYSSWYELSVDELALVVEEKLATTFLNSEGDPFRKLKFINKYLKKHPDLVTPEFIATLIQNTDQYDDQIQIYSIPIIGQVIESLPESTEGEYGKQSIINMLSQFSNHDNEFVRIQALTTLSNVIDSTEELRQEISHYNYDSSDLVQAKIKALHYELEYQELRRAAEM